ncbi:HNH endonuclease family protein [Saccharomonospora sp. NPDC046836]|uniref:HNH endonuclease family protein n=1 Tax=Saccharomonospora sp. NPDC046836 TaxID=3156921 RepID=UPI0033F26CF4
MGSRRGRTRAGALVSLLLAALVAAITWWTQQSGDASDSPETGATTDAVAALDQLASLQVRPEDTGNRYDRDDWPHWSSQGNSCNTREIALQQQGQDVRTDDECRAVAGTWLSSYDGVVMHDAGEADIDHMVPLAEAARSGSRQWTREQRAAFANDLDQLLVVTARSNRQKGDQDPATWLPEQDRCGYAAHWVRVKAKYELSVDQAEHEALEAVLTHCPA